MYLHLIKFKGRRHYSGVVEVEIFVTVEEGQGLGWGMHGGFLGWYMQVCSSEENTSKLYLKCVQFTVFMLDEIKCFKQYVLFQQKIFIGTEKYIQFYMCRQTGYKHKVFQ